MRIASWGHAAFAAAMIGLGIVTLLQGNFASVWDPVPDGAPARMALVYFSAFISLACGLGLLWQRTAILAARVLAAVLMLWFLVFRVPDMIRAPSLGVFFAACDTAVMLAAAWILYTWFATDWDRANLGSIAGDTGVRIAQVLFGLSLINYGVAHFLDVKDTVSLEPAWLPWHTFWAYFFGCTFIAAAVGVLIGVWARLAAALATVQIGMFTLLVWVPIMAAGSKNPFFKSETILSAALTAGAWMVADFYRGTPWLGVGKRQRPGDSMSD